MFDPAQFLELFFKIFYFTATSRLTIGRYNLVDLLTKLLLKVEI